MRWIKGDTSPHIDNSPSAFDKTYLVYLNNSVEFVENTGELLYNLLLEKRTLMNVNNLIAETLDPKNIVAKSYLGQMTEEEKTILLNNNYQHLDKLDKIRNKKLLK